MKKNFFLLLLLISVSIYSQHKTSAINSISALPDSEYRIPVFADTERIAKIRKTIPVIENIFRDYTNKRHIPGLAYGLIIDSSLVYCGTLGYSDISKKIPVNEKTRFRIASMSKSFTAMAILKLRDEGKLSLDDPASEYIPELKNIKYLTTDAPEISIRNLLGHSAGFPEDNPWGDRQLADKDDDLTQLIKKGVTFSNVPEISYEYSNLGFTLLGKIVSIVSGMPYQRYITENILYPLGMKNSVWEYSEIPEKELAHGYKWQNNEWIEEPLLHDGVYGAMGGLISSIEDFSKYVIFHLKATPPRNDKDSGPLKRSSLREMQQPRTYSDIDYRFRYPNGKSGAFASAYSFGLVWNLDYKKRVYIGHPGGLPGFGSQWKILPEYGIGIVAFGNVTYAGFGNVIITALDTIISSAGLEPRKLPASPILELRKNELIRLLPEWKNAGESGIFAENFFMDNSITSLKNKCEVLFEKAGKIIRIQQVVPDNRLRGKFIIECEKMNIGVYFTLSPENPPLIQYFNIWQDANSK